MSKIKFTTDGKKVIVLSALNSQEMIVQEIFVSETGQEFPGGENFVVKSLLDVPAKSWKQSTIEKLEAEYETKRRQLENENENLYKKLKSMTEKTRLVIGAFDAIAKNFNYQSFEILENFLSGKINFVVTKRYGDFHLYPILESPVVYDGQLKLLSMWGKTNGDFSFKLSEYYDGSGNRWTPIWFFETSEQAVNFMQSEIDKLEAYIDSNFKLAEKHGLKLDSVKHAKYYQNLANSKNNAIEVADANKARLVAELDELNLKIKSIVA